MSPALSSEDKRSVQRMRKLARFLVGDFDGAVSPTGGGGLLQGGRCLRKLLPVIREYSLQLREFGALLGIRLTEKALSRGLNYASSRLVS